MTRHLEPGWVELACPDGRRGVWMRVSDTCIELCAGREGDDVHLSLAFGRRVRRGDVCDAYDILAAFKYAQDVAEENSRDKPTTAPVGKGET